MKQGEGQGNECSSFRKRFRQDESTARSGGGAAGGPDRSRGDGGDNDDNDNDNHNDHVAPPNLPPELASVDFTQRVRWGKCHPYSDAAISLVPESAPPAFADDSPALSHHVNAVSHRARACTIHLRPRPGQGGASGPPSTSSSEPVTTPMFMPVGTKGCLKALSYDEWTTDPALSFPIVLANTYHLALQPGTDLIRECGGLHAFQGRGDGGGDGDGCGNNGDDEDDEDAHDSDNVDVGSEIQRRKRVPYNLLTDSGGFQMVSLAKLSTVTEEGVSFENPFRSRSAPGAPNAAAARSTDDHDDDNNNDLVAAPPACATDLMLLTPEDSIRHQNNIGANIIMALDDVVSSVVSDPSRFQVATHRTLRWYDRCYRAHTQKSNQNLFPIVQGGLDSSLGGLREQCLAGFRHRQLNLRYQTPGYAIGGLAGGESKDDFWKVVDQCCQALPDDKPRYLMGVGYPLDLVVCTALGVDLYDCVYPTRTARFGVCLVPGRAPGTLRLKARECAADARVVQDGCRCQPCREGVSRARLHALLKAGNPLAVELVTQHNLAHMMSLVRSMRQAVLRDEFGEYARDFVREQYPGKDNGGLDPPGWVVDALAATGIHLAP